MKQKILFWMTMIVVILSVALQTQAAEAIEPNKVLEDILQSQCQLHGDVTLQELVDSYFADNALNGNVECFVMGMAPMSQEIDMTVYQKALETQLEETSDLSASRMQKAAITLQLLGADANIRDEALARTGEDTIMSYIYGLMYSGRLGIQDEQSLNALMQMQLADGGFAYVGEEGDVDVTAMALQAFSFYPELCQDTIAGALDFLSKQQLVDGDFSSMGNANSESTAQVLIALETLGIDWAEDPAWIKQGNTVMDGLLRYQLVSGSFCHAIGGKENEMASSQAFLAMTTVAAREEKVESGQGVIREQEHALYQNTGLLRWILTGVATVLGILGCVIFRKKKKWRDIFILILVLGVACLWLVSGARRPSASEAPASSIKEEIQVKVSIDCMTVLGREPSANTTTDFSKVLPEDGILLKETDVILAKGDTVFDLLQKVCQDIGLQLEYRSDSAYGSAYIEGMGYLYEFDYGDLSGWMYLVNGEFPNMGCGEYVLKDGDVVEWVYSTEIGKDIER